MQGSRRRVGRGSRAKRSVERCILPSTLEINKKSPSQTDCTRCRPRPIAPSSFLSNLSIQMLLPVSISPNSFRPPHQTRLHRSWLPPLRLQPSSTILTRPPHPHLSYQPSSSTTPRPSHPTQAGHSETHFTTSPIFPLPRHLPPSLVASESSFYATVLSLLGPPSSPFPSLHRQKRQDGRTEASSKLSDGRRTRRASSDRGWLI
jgi:hypothetical protein